MKVAQIARSLAERLILGALDTTKEGAENQRERILRHGGLDPYVAEAAALAHDIGHPPFGHAGEAALDQLCTSNDPMLSVTDGFEGNAQTFRIAVKTDGSYGERFGLNLTAATRAAIIKYPWQRPTRESPGPAMGEVEAEFRKSKFGYYLSERKDFGDARAWMPEHLVSERSPSQSLEASIMDIADDITYAVHDFEDFLTVGLLNPDTVLREIDTYLADPDSTDSVIGALAYDLDRNYKSFFEQARLVSCAESQRGVIALIVQDGTLSRKQRNRLLDDLTSSIYIRDTPIGDVRTYVQLGSSEWHTVQLFKHLVKHYVVERPGLALMQAGQIAILRESIGRLQIWQKTDWKRIPIDLKDRIQWVARENAPPDRAYLDYLCTLGDAQIEGLVAAMSGRKIPMLWSSPVG